MLTVIVTKTGKYLCIADSYCDNNGGLYVVLTVIMTITVISICSANSYCDNNDNNGEVNI